MRIAVTGGAGYIGSVLVPRLLDAGHNLRVIDRLFWGTPAFAGHPNLELCNADVRRLPEDAFARCDAVIHLAGFSNDPTAEFSPAANWEMNARATETIASLCQRAGVGRLVFAGSCSVYDGVDGGDALLDEETPLRPRGAYAEAKHFSEGVLLGHSGSLEVVILRQATVYGASPRMRFDLVVNSFAKDALCRGRLVLHGGGLMWRPLVNVEDLAAVYEAALTAPGAAVDRQVFNVVGGNFQVKDLATRVAEVLGGLGRPVELTAGPLPRLIRSYRCSGSKLEDALGVAFPTSPELAVADLVTVYGSRSVEELSHPRYYNIAWMELLEQVRPAFEALPNIFEPLEH